MGIYLQAGPDRAGGSTGNVAKPSANISHELFITQQIIIKTIKKN